MADAIHGCAVMIYSSRLMICNLCEVGDIQHLRVDDIQREADDIQGFRLDDIHGCAAMHTVFNGILRYSACTTDE